MYYDRFSSKQIQVMNSVGRQKIVNVVYAYKFPMLGALTTIACTPMYYNCRNLSTSVQEKEMRQVNKKIL